MAMPKPPPKPPPLPRRRTPCQWCLYVNNVVFGGCLAGSFTECLWAQGGGVFNRVTFTLCLQAKFVRCVINYEIGFFLCMTGFCWDEFWGK